MNAITDYPIINVPAGDKPGSAQQLCALVNHPDRMVRLRVAEHPGLPPACLAELAGDDWPEVRIAVAENPSTPVLILELLSEDLHPDVRYTMAENAATPEHILHILVQDENPYVVARACKTLARLNQKKPTVRLCRCA